MKKLIGIISGICLLAACQEDTIELDKSYADKKVVATAVENSVRGAQTIQVSGQINEDPMGVGWNRTNTWTGSLVGEGYVTLTSLEFIDADNAIDIITYRRLNTSDGNLFLEEVGEHHDGIVTVNAIVKGGTGIYKNAKGQLNLIGVHEETGVRLFEYTGSIILAN